MENNKVGNFIAEMRKKKNLTQQQLGDKLYVTDKAVSKWERGKSLPDITLLTKLAGIFEVEVEDILSGEINKNKKSINIDERIKELQISIETRNKKQIKKYITIIGILIILLSLVVFKNIYLGYSVKNVYYEHSKKEISIGLPKLSFNIKTNDLSYSAYNLRGTYILENEVKRYLKTLKYSNCNNTIYYYDEKNDISIIDYKIKNKLLFNTISYTVADHDYCESKKIEEYKDKLNGINRFHLLNGGKLSQDMKGNMIEIAFLDGIKISDDKRQIYTEYYALDTEHYTYKAQLRVMYYIRLEDLKDKGVVERRILEDSTGTIEIKDNKLYYYRNEIKETTLELPEVSIFEIGEDGYLTLTNNYLSKYQKEIILQ